MAPDFSFSKNLKLEIEKATPSFEVAAFKADNLLVKTEIGETHQFYDIASVTKIVFTVTALMQAVDRKLLNVEDTVLSHLSWFPAENIQVTQLLAHHSGLQWWDPVYEHLRDEGRLSETDYPANWQYVKDVLRKLPIGDGRLSTYSDLDFWALGFLLEKIYEKSLAKIWHELSSHMQMPETGFSEANQPRFDRSLYAPTEDCPWRRKILRGEVHDDNTWTFGGVAPHAGLFSSMRDLSTWAMGLRCAYLGGDWIVSSETVQHFAEQEGPGFWALGFMMPNKENSSAGSKMSGKAIGHWGFTGPGIWFDPENDITVITLANRVHPTRDNQKFNLLRPKIHDEIYHFLGVQ